MGDSIARSEQERHGRSQLIEDRRGEKDPCLSEGNLSSDWGNGA